MRWLTPTDTAKVACWVLPVLAAFFACNVEERSADTGGLGGALGLGGSDGCPSAVAVVLSDYASTQVALVDAFGQTLSESLISTASSRTDGLSFALSGDVVLPGTQPESGLVVLLDRFGTNVVTFIDPFSGRVLHQLPIGTGFESNPQDYVEAAGKGFVARFGQNTEPGREAFDDGGDLLVVDPSAAEIRGQVRLPVWDGLPARPTALAVIGDEVLVTLARIALDFRTTGRAALVGVLAQEQEVSFTYELDYKSCGRATLSPDGARFAVACSGALDPSGDVDAIEDSGILIFSATSRPLELIDELPASELGEGPLQSDVAFVTGDLILVKTQTPIDTSAHNRLLAVDLRQRLATTLLEASADDSGQGKGIVYGGLFCPGTCPGACLLADADRNVLQRIVLNAEGELELLPALAVEQSVGLPPVALSPF